MRRGYFFGNPSAGENCVPEMNAILYTRHGCHLCDDAKAILENHGLTVESVDIDADPRLVERYGECVPVVVVNGQERFRGRVDPMLLRRLLRRK
jgi:glutaredoxin